MASGRLHAAPGRTADHLPPSEHAYQAATDTGVPHRRIIGTVTELAGLGALLAAASLAVPSPLAQVAFVTLS